MVSPVWAASIAAWMVEYGQPLAQTRNLPARAVDGRIPTPTITATRSMTKRIRISLTPLAYRSGHRTNSNDSLQLDSSFGITSQIPPVLSGTRVGKSACAGRRRARTWLTRERRGLLRSSPRRDLTLRSVNGRYRALEEKKEIPASFTGAARAGCPYFLLGPSRC